LVSIDLGDLLRVDPEARWQWAQRPACYRRTMCAARNQQDDPPAPPPPPPADDEKIARLGDRRSRHGSD
jgi:hypothetical protein